MSFVAPPEGGQDVKLVPAQTVAPTSGEAETAERIGTPRARSPRPMRCPALPFATARAATAICANGRARWCWSICGRPGARHASAKCPVSTGSRPSWAAPNFAVLPISLDRTGPDKPRQFIASNGLKHLDLYLDSGNTLMQTLRAPGLPLSVLIDRQGREIARLAGPAEWDAAEAEALIRAAIGKAGDG